MKEVSLCKSLKGNVCDENKEKKLEKKRIPIKNFFGGRK